MNKLNRDPIAAAPNKHCEHCWDISQNAYYLFVVESHLIIFLKSPHIISHNQLSRSVILSNGQSIEYDFLVGNIAHKIKQRYIPHIFCSFECALNMTKTKMSFSTELLNLTPIFDCTNKKLPVWDPLVIDVRGINYIEQACTQCDRIFPDVDKKFIVVPIEDVRVIEGQKEDMHLPAGFDVGHGDQNEKHPVGHTWFFKLNHNASQEKHFCSDQCTYEYSKINNAIILYPNLVLNGWTTMITPYTPEANKGLGIRYPFRPQKMYPIES